MNIGERSERGKEEREREGDSLRSYKLADIKIIVMCALKFLFLFKEVWGIKKWGKKMRMARKGFLGLCF